MAIAKRIRKGKGKKTTVYQAEVYVSGEVVAQRYFETAAEAHKWHDETKQKYAAGNSPAMRSEELVFDECLTRYFNDDAFTSLRQSSRQARAVRLRHLRDAPLSRIKMRDFNARHVDDWLQWLREQPTAQSKKRKTFRHELQLLSIVLNWYRNELNPSFIVPVVKRHRKKCVFKQVVPRRPDYFMRCEDIARWLDALKQQSNPVYFHLATFMILTGTRLGEAAGMNWDAVGLAQNVAWIVRTLSWDHHTREPYLQDEAKNEESIRVLRLAPHVVEMLSGLKRSAGDVIVFGNGRGGYLRDNAIRSAFDRGFAACGLPWTATRITRHTWATWGLVASNSNISAVQMNMGHGQRTTTETYAKPVAALTSEVVDKTALLLLPGHHVRNHVTSSAPNEKALH